MQVRVLTAMHASNVTAASAEQPTCEDMWTPSTAETDVSHVTSVFVPSKGKTICAVISNNLTVLVIDVVFHVRTAIFSVAASSTRTSMSASAAES